MIYTNYSNSLIEIIIQKLTFEFFITKFIRKFLFRLFLKFLFRLLIDEFIEIIFERFDQFFFR